MKAPLQFLKSLDKEAAYIANAAGEEIKPHIGEYQDVNVALANGREQIKTLSLDVEGFKLVKHQTGVSNFLNEADISNVYEPELIALLKKETGAKHAEVFDHTRRSTSLEARQKNKVREAVFLAHNDYSASSGIQRLNDYIAENPTLGKQVSKDRFAIVNVWRSMAGVVKNHTLAMSDASSVKANDLISVKRKSDNREGEIQFVLYNSEQRWFYFPELSPDEVLIVKTFDSQTDGRARFTPHTAFTNKSSGVDIIRESIESRCFLFF